MQELSIGSTCYVKYKGCRWHGEVIAREYPYWVIRMSNGLEMSFYSDEIETE